MNSSLWLDRTKGKQYPKIETETTVQTLIVGAGVTGLTTAYYLSKVTNDVMVIDADQIGYGSSGRSTGKLSSQHGLIYKDLVRHHDYSVARQYYEAQREAIDSIEEIIHQHHIACDFKRCASVVFTQDETKIAQLQEEYQVCMDLRIPCRYLEEVNFPMKVAGAIRFYNQAKYDPYRYLLGLSDILDEKHIPIYEHSSVKHIVKEHGKYKVLVNDTCIYAENVVLATQFPILDHKHLYFTRTYPHVSSLAAIPLSQDLSEDMLINVEEPTKSYNRVHVDDQNWLLCGGNAHGCGECDAQSVENWHHEILKDFHAQEITYSWTTQDYLAMDKLPLIGPIDKEDAHLLFATGFQKWGNTNGNLAGKLLSAYILGQPSQYQELCDPHRLSNIFTPKYFKENFQTVMHLMKSKFPEIESQYPEKNKANVMKIDNHNYGVYRDNEDTTFVVDITCPHLGCTCTFNDIDKTWDCPCHGSRFHYDGTIIKGPSTMKLNAYGEGLNDIDPHILDDKD